jgi:1-phosphofructokinase
MIFTVTLNPSIDYTMEADSFKIGCLNRSRGEFAREGGKGINVSCVLKALGIETKALGFVGGFTGKEIARLVEEKGIKNGFITVDRGITRINVKISGKNETEINGSGPEISEADFQRLWAMFDEAKKGDMFIFSGSAPKSAVKNVYERLAQRACEKGVSFIVDTEGQQLLSTLKYEPFMVKPNLKELEDIFGAKIETDEGIIAYGKKLQQGKTGGAQNVLISMGKDGAVLLCSDGRVLKTKAPKGKVISTVGSGDSMVAGFAAGMQLYGDYEKAFRLALAAGSACAFSRGMPEKGKIMEVLILIK